MGQISISILLILSLSSSFLHPATSTCAPRTDPFQRLLTDFLPPPSLTPSSAPSASPHPSPRLIRLRPSPQSPTPTPSHSPAPKPTQHLSIQSIADSVSSAIHSLQTAFLDGSVTAICDKTDHPDVCTSAIQSLAPDLAHAEPRTVLKVSMKAAAEIAHVAIRKANELVNDPSNDKQMKSIFSVCADGFEDVLSDLRDAATAMEGDDKGTMMTDLSALFSDFGSCGDAFAEASKVSPLKEFEDLLYKHAGNCLAIGELI